jgi:4-amino-4-deoxy-L-arabinose transferase-like glycosyltransferase
MRLSTRHQLLITAIGLIVFFVNLGATRLWDQDEAYFARTAVEMQQRHEWIVPYFNGEVFAHKPPLMFWMMRIGFVLFGVNEFAARFWSATFAVATALLVYRLGRRMFNAEAGLWSGIAICTAMMFDVVARAATPDSFLVFFSTLAIYLFARHENWDNGPEGTSASAPDRPRSWRAWAAIYASMGLAVLVKGPIGVLLPGSTIGLYSLLRNPIESRGPQIDDRFVLFIRRFSPARIATAIWTMRPLIAIATILAVSGPWFVLVGWRTGGQFLSEFFGTQNYGRFFNAMDHHSGGIWYYIPAVLAGFFPWSMFAIPTAIDLTRRCRGKESWRRGARFIASWAIVWISFFSLASTKLPNYVLPAYPALALATGCLIEKWIRQEAAVRPLMPRLSFGSMIAVGCAIVIGAAVMAHRTASGVSLLERIGATPDLTRALPLIGLLGAILVAGGAMSMTFIERRQHQRAMLALAATAVLFCTTTLAAVAVQVDKLQPTPDIAAAIREHVPGQPQIAQFGYFRPSLVYYADAHVEACKTPQRTAEFLAQSAESFVVTTEDNYARLAALLPPEIAVLKRQADFPRGQSVVLLGHKTELAKASGSATK